MTSKRGEVSKLHDSHFRVVAQFEFQMASLLVVAGVILSAAVFQAERRISRYDAVYHGRSLGPLVKTRALRDDALWRFKIQTEPLPTSGFSWQRLHPCGMIRQKLFVLCGD
jgi:hypothetical protein